MKEWVYGSLETHRASLHKLALRQDCSFRYLPLTVSNSLVQNADHKQDATVESLL